MNGLDLFSGIGGLTLALNEWVCPVAYCENDPYAAAVLLSRMHCGELPEAPIWDDIQTLKGESLPAIDIIYGGFPCQDISCAGRGAGLEGERSSLFFEVARLVRELRPQFVFLENVSAIVTRGLERVVGELSELGYDCRWTIVRASDVGAPHIRARWWLLAYTGGAELRVEPRRGGRSSREGAAESRDDGARQPLADATSLRWEQGGEESRGSREGASPEGVRCGSANSGSFSDSYGFPPRRPAEPWGQRGYWSAEPNVGRVANGIPARVDRLRGLGNAVVPLQARTAFEILSGLRGAA